MNDMSAIEVYCVTDMSAVEVYYVGLTCQQGRCTVGLTCGKTNSSAFFLLRIPDHHLSPLRLRTPKELSYSIKNDPNLGNLYFLLTTLFFNA